MLALAFYLLSTASFADEPALESACAPQPAQSFLIRGNMKKDPRGFPTAVKEAIRWRVNTYGYVPEVTPRHEGPGPVAEACEETTFFGLPVKLHRKTLPSLRCIEAELQSQCVQGPDLYFPRALSGLRLKNSYRGGEVSNHMFGLALDVDPDRNPCCGCVPPWSDVPKCKRPSDSPFDRADLPECWVRVFERHGYYWLGWDSMQDTMHFEFLGIPPTGR